MANSKILNAGDKLAEEYKKELDKVLVKLDRILVDTTASLDAAGILNNRAAYTAALKESGYTELNAWYVGEYEKMPQVVKDSMKARSIPLPRFTPVDAEIFAGLASADLQAFTAIGVNAMDELRLGLYKQAVSNQPFSALVEAVRAATVGVDGKGSPMANHAATIANTAILDFGGETLRIAGENIGADKWEVVGPNDSVTRIECQEALGEPIRTEEEWKQHSGSTGEPYWGGTPGSWNCRHQLFPVVTA
jgi:hypothetical protein